MKQEHPSVFRRGMATLFAGVLIILCLALPAQAAPGHFYLVSTGIGDPDNITLRAINTIKGSEIVFADDDMVTVFPDLLAGKTVLPRPSIKIHKYFQSLKSGYFQGGKTAQEGNRKVLSQLDEFKKTVTRAIDEGKDVALLENGDSCIYGPYIWTMEVFKDLDPVIVPGISSLNAGNAALKKGLTFGYAAHSAVLTNAADLKDGYDGADTIERMAATRASLVVFTMFTELENLVDRLVKYYPEDTPAAIVIKAGYKEEERVISGTLSTIVETANKAGDIPFEHLIYIGDFMTEQIERTQ